MGYTYFTHVLEAKVPKSYLKNPNVLHPSVWPKVIIILLVICLIINIIRNLLLVKRKECKWVERKSTMLVILALLTAMTIYTWSGIISLLPFIMVAVTTIGYWTNNAQKIRLSQFIGSPCVLLYDVLIQSWGGVLNETITLVSIIISVIRFGWKNMGSPDSDF